MELNRPTLLIDEVQCRANIDLMRMKADHNELIFRPHFKTHISRKVGSWFADVGVTKITVSSVSMAEYFAPDWNDITIAFPINIRELTQINNLAGQIRLNVIVESPEVVQCLEKGTQAPLGVFIKIDVGTGRTGLKHDDNRIDQILDALQIAPNLSFRGFLAHAGHSYQCRTKEELQKVYLDSAAIMHKLDQIHRPTFPDLVLSYGDTPTCSIMDDLSAIDEMRPGNFVFYDLMQWQIGSCQLEDIAVKLACPVVSTHKDRNEVVVYGGAVHFSKETLLHPDYGAIYGMVLEENDKSTRLMAGAFVKKLSQEHGIVHMPKNEIKNVRPGDIIYVLPIHSCLTMNLMKSFSTLVV